MLHQEEYSIPIKLLFELTNTLHIDFEVAENIQKYAIKIKTPLGWQIINNVVRKYAETAEYLFDDDSSLTCATNHLVYENNTCKPIYKCKSIDTVDGQINIIGSTYKGNTTLYDVSIDAPHMYITTNGIIHHNTTLVKCLLNELGVESSDIKYVNGSHTNGVDDIRALSRFAETMPNGDFRYVVLDECLYENTSVWVLRNGHECNVAIKDLDTINDLVKSYNIENNRIEWQPFNLIDKGTQEVIEIEFENGEVIICTPSHKWYVKDYISNEEIVVRADELYKYNHILTI